MPRDMHAWSAEKSNHQGQTESGHLPEIKFVSSANQVVDLDAPYKQYRED